MVTVGEVWREAQARLEAAHEVGPREGQALVEALLGVDGVGRRLLENQPFLDELRARLEQFVVRRAAGEPLAHILGYAWFYGRRWTVTPEVLIPRPDTEVLVQAVLERLQARDRIVEVGVGSGCIGGTLLAEREDVTLVGVDISAAAVAVAQRNIEALGVAPARFALQVADGLDVVKKSFNLLVSNPPYVTDAEWEGLEGEVRNFEPRLALTGDMANADGLVFYRRLAAWGRELVQPRGWLCVEVGWQQGPAVRDLLEEEGATWCEISVLKDLSGRGRVVCARRSG